LYPIRVKDFTEFAAVNYDKWDICDPFFRAGTLYKFVKEGLTRKFGEDCIWNLKNSSREREIILN
jgi:hypothetical protein